MTRGAFAKRSVLVTGATGLLGSWLVRELLAHDAEVVALVRDMDPNSEFIRGGDNKRVIQVSGEVEDFALLTRVFAQYEIEVAFHLGAQTQITLARNDPLNTLESNIRGTYNMLEAARQNPASLAAFVLASSDKAYGEGRVLPYRESDPLAGSGIYDVSKSAADLVARSYAHTYQLPIGIARCGNLYGGGDLNWERIVPGSIRSLLNDERPVIRSDGTPRRDYLYVDDAVSGYIALATALMGGSEHGEAFNFGWGQGTSVQDVVHHIAQVVGRSDLSPDIRSEGRDEISDQWLDSSKAAARLEWTPAVPLETGLAHTVDWYRQLLDGTALPAGA